MMRKALIVAFALSILGVMVALVLPTRRQDPVASTSAMTPAPEGGTIASTEPKPSAPDGEAGPERAPGRAMRPIPTLAADSPGTAWDASAWPELPPVDAPLRSVFDTLRSRALRGDASAACRLAVDLGRCRVVALAAGEIAAGALVPDDRSLLPRDREARKAWLARCQGVDAGQRREEYGMLKRAALAGHETALSLYLDGQLFVSDGAANLAYLDDWRAEAPRVFDAAVRNGSMTAQLLAANAERGKPAPFLQSDADPFDAEVRRLLTLFASLKLPAEFGAPEESDALARLRQRSVLDARRFAEAEALARQRAEAWYGDPSRIEAFADHWRLKVSFVGDKAGLDANAVCRSGYLPPLVPPTDEDPE